MKFRLTIEGELIDVFNDETVIFNRSIQNIRDISKLFSDFTQSFNVPASKKNNQIFSYFYDLDVQGTYNQHLKASATIEFDNVYLMGGEVELIKAQRKGGNPTSYDIVFYGNIKSLDTIMSEDTLQDVDFSTYNHTLTYANVTNSWNETLNSGNVIYPLFDTGRNWLWSNQLQTNPNNINIANFGTVNDENYGGINLNELKPAIRLPSMIETIFENYGFDLVSNWLADADTQKIYIQPNRIAGVMRDEDNGLNANFSVNITSAKSFSQNVYYKVPFDNEAYDLANSFTLPSLYTAQYTGTHILKTESLFNATSPAAGRVWSIYFYKNGVKLAFPVISGMNYNALTPQSNTVNLNLSKNDTIEVYVRSTAATANSLDHFKLVKTGGAFNLFNQTVEVNKRMPDLKVSDFIAGFLKTFNLILEPIDTTSFRLEPLDDWYAQGTIKNYDTYIDHTTEDILKVPVYKSIDFKHADTKDISSTTFKSFTFRDFGRITYAPNVDFGDSEFKIETPFTVPVPTTLDETDGNGKPTGASTGIHLHKYIDDTGKEIAPNLTMVYFNGKQACGGYYLQSGIDLNDNPLYGFVADYGHFSVFSDYLPTVNSNTLTYSIEQPLTNAIFPVNTLFQRYYNNYIGRIYDRSTKILVCEAVVPLGVFLNLKLNDKIIYNGQQFTINSFKYDFLKEKAYLELLTYDIGVAIQSVSAVGGGNSELSFVLPPTNRDISSYNAIPNTAGTEFYLQTFADIINKETNAGLLKLTDADAADKMRFRGDFVSGTAYEVNDVVTENGWTQVVTDVTTDSPKPTFVGAPAFTLPDAPIWTYSSVVDYIITGNVYTFNRGGIVSSYRVFTPEISEFISYIVILNNITDPSNVISQSTAAFSGVDNGWVTVNIKSKIVAKNSVFELLLYALNSSANTLVSGNWDYNGKENNAAPDDQGWNRNNQHTSLRFSINDKLAANRKADLLLVTIGTQLKVTNDVDVNQFWVYEIDADPIDNTTYISYTVTLIETGSGGGVPVAANTLSEFNIPQADSTQYSFLIDYWDANTPEWASIQGYKRVGGAAKVNDNEAYGTDIEFTEAILSPDYGFISFTDIGQAVAGLIVNTVNVTGGGVNVKDIGGEVVIELLDNATYTLPLISTFTTSFMFNLVNLSGVSLTILPSGSDEISGETSQTLSYYDSMKLYINTSDYIII